MRRALPLAALLVLGCPRAIPAPERPEAASPDAGPSSAAQALEARVDALDAEVGQVLAATDEALWAHWTTGAALDLAAASAGHAALFTPATLAVLRQAQREGVAARRAALLEQWLLNELLSRALAPEAEAIASLEAGATFALDGKELAWRELPRLLASEKSAVKRRALWTAALPVAARLDGLLAHKEGRAAAVLAELGGPSPQQLRERTRELDLAALGATARELLAATERPWRATLAELSQGELKLPVEALTRADLPRLLRAPPAVDAAFPRGAVGTRAVDTLQALGLGGRDSPALDLSGSGRKQPLPLTVAPSPAQVRLAYKPAGGLRDQALLLSELGSALALSAAATGHPSLDRLGDPARPGAAAALLAGLVGEPGWLEARGVPEAVRPQAVRHARALALYAVRRMAASVLLHLEPADAPEAEARERGVALLASALGVRVAPAEGARLRLELDDGLRGASQLKASLAAAALRRRLGPSWWAAPASGEALLAAFGPGASQPLEVDLGPAGDALAALLEQLGVDHAGEAAPDAGTPPPSPPVPPQADGGT